MHVDEFIFNYCVSSMISDDIPEPTSECAMNVFSIDENKIRDANGIIFAEAITCYKCTFCGKMFAAMEVVLTHYQSNHRCSVIPLLKGLSKLSAPKLKAPKANPLNGTQTQSTPKSKPSKSSVKILPKSPLNSDLRNTRSLTESVSNSSRLLRDSTKGVKIEFTANVSKKKFKCLYPGCSKAFTYSNGLQNHQKCHKSRKPYKCNWNDCKFKCSDLAGLEFHKTTHSGDNPYQCSWPGCHQSFADAVAKEEHMLREHIGDRILECDYPGCGANFIMSTDRDRHKFTHLGKKISAPKPVPTLTLGVARRGRPKRKPIVESSSSESESNDSEDEEELEDNEEVVNEMDNQMKENIIKNREEMEANEQPLDLSKTAIDLTIESKPEVKTPAKRGRKRKKSKDNGKVIPKKVFRCDYPGCRKTFPDSDVLKQHEMDTHKTPVTDGRSRHSRKCKGNLYYKV